MKHWESVLVCVLGLVCASQATGETYSIRLRDLEGTYSTGNWGPLSRSATFDFGTRFIGVTRVRFHIVGTLAPSMYRNTTENPALEYQVHPHLVATMRASNEPGVLPTEFVVQGAFDEEKDSWHPTVEYPTAPSFLAQGKGELQLSLWTIPPGDDFASERIPALMGISEATLYIDAVPEPTVLSLAAPACLWALARRRCGC